MKIRAAFVSNSSSSSFVVGFDHKPANVKELQEMLFGTAETYVSPYSEMVWRAEDVAQVVWRDLQEQMPADEQKIKDEVGSGYFEGYPYDYPFGGSREAWAEHENKVDKARDAYFNRVKGRFEGKQVFVFEYEDHTDLGSAMEHGDLFRRLPHVTISKH